VTWFGIFDFEGRFGFVGLIIVQFEVWGECLALGCGYTVLERKREVRVRFSLGVFFFFGVRVTLFWLFVWGGGVLIFFWILGFGF